jgi:ABC-type glycerol-3-phosphate transport system substrate-binding protein
MDWFAEANLPTDPAQFPVTWDALSSAAVKLTRREGEAITRAGFDCPLDFREWRSLFWQSGEEEWNADESKMTFNDSAGIDALTYLSDLALKQRVAPAAGMTLPSGSPNTLAAGLTAIQRLNPRTANLVRLAAPEMWPNIGFGAPHKKTRQVTHVENDGWAMSPGAKEPDGGFAFLAFLMDPPQMLAYNQILGEIPPRKSLSTSQHMQQAHLKQFSDSIDKFGHAYRSDGNQAAILKQLVDDVVNGRKAVRQSLDDAVQEANRVLQTLPPAPK